MSVGVADRSSTFVPPNNATWCDEIGKLISSKLGSFKLHARALSVVGPATIAMAVAIKNRFFMIETPLG
jgi:hypothetical protein